MMNTTKERPTLKPLRTGDEFQTFVVTGKAGMAMPSHISTKEAVVVIQEGSAVLNMDGKEHKLETDDVFIIPGSRVHTLSLNSDFKALVLMSRDSKIEFK